MELAYITLIVSDVRRAVLRAGIRLRAHHSHDAGDYAELRTGQTRLAFAADQLAERHLPIPLRGNRADQLPAGVELTFTAGDVDAAFVRAVELGATPVVSPTEKPWGRTAYIRDPYGVLIQLFER